MLNINKVYKFKTIKMNFFNAYLIIYFTLITINKGFK